MKKKRKFLSIISACLAIFAICGFSLFSILDYKKNQQVKADNYHMLFTFNNNTNDYSYYPNNYYYNGYRYDNLSCEFTIGGYEFTYYLGIRTDGSVFYRYELSSLYIYMFASGTEFYGGNELGDYDIYISENGTNRYFRYSSSLIVDSNEALSPGALGILAFNITNSSLTFDIHDENSHGVTFPSIDLGRYNIYRDGSSNNPLNFNTYIKSFSFANSTDFVEMDTFNLDYQFSQFEEGYLSGYTAGYQDGYQSGSSEGYNGGYDNGYNVGYQEGVDSQQSVIESAYSTGYADGFNFGTEENETVVSIFSGILSVAMVPVNFFLAIFNFEILGINISAFIKALFTVVLTVIVLKTVLGKGGGTDDN